MKSFLTHSTQETQSVAKEFATSLSGGDVVCLHGDLGGGKTTFTQGVLEAFGAEKPFVSPTFLIMKTYELTHSPQHTIQTIHHIDAYRIESHDMQELGWEEMIQDKKSLLIIEWPEKISDLIPTNAIHIHFSWKSEGDREISIDRAQHNSIYRA